MSSAPRKQMAYESMENRSSPDWEKTENGRTGRTDKQRFTDDDFVELKYRSVDNIATSKMAKGLGLFSIALGLAEVLAPAQVGEMAGVSNRFKTALPVLGAREIAHGIGILSSAKPTTAVWTRVGGDAIDLAYLGAAAFGTGSNKKRLIGAAVAVLGVTALDLFCAQKLSSTNWSESDGNPMAPTTIGQASGRKTMDA